MAPSIIRAVARPARIPDDIKRTENFDHDEYRGPIDSLLAAGIVRTDQLPSPGHHAISYFQGQVIKRPGRPKRDETYLRVAVYDDGSAHVLVGVPPDVAAARRTVFNKAEAKRLVERIEMMARREEMKDPGWDAIRGALPSSPARFNVGDLCMHVDGYHLEISGEYRLHKVMHDDGRYMDEAGRTFNYKYGYSARQLGGSAYFYEAGELLDAEGCVKHLQLV